jgi:osomolarity two-component system sensor histidine kinase NIK1
MASVDQTLVAATAMLQFLARDEPTRSSVPPQFDFEFPATNGAKISKLPGKPSPAKVAFETELEALIRRVHHLEFQAVSHHEVPDNPQQTTPSVIRSNEKNPILFVDFRGRSLVVRLRF